MKGLTRIGKSMLAVGMLMAFGMATASDGSPPPASTCTENGQVAVVELVNGLRYFICSNGQWQFTYECTYVGSQCVIH